MLPLLDELVATERIADRARQAEQARAAGMAKGPRLPRALFRAGVWGWLAQEHMGPRPGLAAARDLGARV